MLTFRLACVLLTAHAVHSGTILQDDLAPYHDDCTLIQGRTPHSVMLEEEDFREVKEGTQANVALNLSQEYGLTDVQFAVDKLLTHRDLSTSVQKNILESASQKFARLLNSSLAAERHRLDNLHESLRSSHGRQHQQALFALARNMTKLGKAAVNVTTKLLQRTQAARRTVLRLRSQLRPGLQAVRVQPGAKGSARPQKFVPNGQRLLISAIDKLTTLATSLRFLIRSSHPLKTKRLLAIQQQRASSKGLQALLLAALVRADSAIRDTDSIVEEAHAYLALLNSKLQNVHQEVLNMVDEPVIGSGHLVDAMAQEMDLDMIMKLDSVDDVLSGAMEFNEALSTTRSAARGGVSSRAAAAIMMLYSFTV